MESSSKHPISQVSIGDTIIFKNNIHPNEIKGTVTGRNLSGILYVSNWGENVCTSCKETEIIAILSKETYEFKKKDNLRLKKQVTVSEAIEALAKGKKVVAELPQEKYPMCYGARRIWYDPKSDYSIGRTLIVSADWYIDE